MKKLFASASYSFNNFYNNLNTQGQMIFSIIIFLIIVLCILLFITYLFQEFQSKYKLKKLKKETINYKSSDQELNLEDISEESNSNNEIQNIANAIKDALKEESPISLTNFEEDQEKTAIISIDELMQKAKELELIDDEEKTGINYLEKYNLEPAEVDKVVNDTMDNGKANEVKAFKVSQVISPIYGVKKEAFDNKNN